ncbi:MAG: hypothetical protein COC19_08265 [SAR86 cluster bacterium]|uniref:Uncharacterized protein n=1 Tax=SAR86 cluster bacterium TaxID=2030880 RepID=A0A2A4MF30_9GAMM|nr:MAG: hypothetical protein COC19_08265 [SAR86 cluster bacterium]
MQKVFVAILLICLACNSVMGAESRSLSQEYDRSIDWYGVQLVIDGLGYKVSIYMNDMLIEHVFMDDEIKSEGIFQLQNTDAPNKKITPEKYKSIFSLNRGLNFLKIEYALVGKPIESNFAVIVHAGKMFTESIWKLTQIENPTETFVGVVEFEFHLPGDLSEDRLLF